VFILDRFNTYLRSLTQSIDRLSSELPFEEAVTQALQLAEPLSLDWVALQEQLRTPEVMAGSFYTEAYAPGEFCPTVYRAHDYMMNLHFSRPVTTDLHNHSFKGGFKLLHGTYHELSIEPENPIGKFTSRKIQAGSTVKIKENPNYFHSLKKIDPLNVTLVVRTFGTDVSTVILYSREQLSYTATPLFKERYGEVRAALRACDEARFQELVKDFDPNQKLFLFYASGFTMGYHPFFSSVLQRSEDELKVLLKNIYKFHNFLKSSFDAA
jgi:hypothetical protein